MPGYSRPPRRQGQPVPLCLGVQRRTLGRPGVPRRTRAVRRPASRQRGRGHRGPRQRLLLGKSRATRPRGRGQSHPGSAGARARATRSTRRSSRWHASRRSRPGRPRSTPAARRRSAAAKRSSSPSPPSGESPRTRSVRHGVARAAALALRPFDPSIADGSPASPSWPRSTRSTWSRRDTAAGDLPTISPSTQDPCTVTDPRWG